MTLMKVAMKLIDWGKLLEWAPTSWTSWLFIQRDDNDRDAEKWTDRSHICELWVSRLLSIVRGITHCWELRFRLEGCSHNILMETRAKGTKAYNRSPLPFCLELISTTIGLHLCRIISWLMRRWSANIEDPFSSLIQRGSTRFNLADLSRTICSFYVCLSVSVQYGTTQIRLCSNACAPHW